MLAALPLMEPVASMRTAWPLSQELIQHSDAMKILALSRGIATAGERLRGAVAAASAAAGSRHNCWPGGGETTMWTRAGYTAVAPGSPGGRRAVERDEDQRRKRLINAAALDHPALHDPLPRNTRLHVRA